MKKLLNYYNSLTEEARQLFLDACEMTDGYLRKACSKCEKLNPIKCVSIEKATNGQVSRKDLRPDDWEKIWPELA